MLVDRKSGRPLNERDYVFAAGPAASERTRRRYAMIDKKNSAAHSSRRQRCGSESEERHDYHSTTQGRCRRSHRKLIAAATAEVDSRTRELLRGAIVPTLLRLAWPNILVMLAQASTGLIETWWVSHLGTDALAGMALVFPVVMLMQMVSAGAMGGGISSAVARALGAGRRDEADALVLHAVIVNVALGAFFSIVMLVFGPSIYRALGGTDGELQTALSYSNVVFAGNILLWLMNALASVIRGTGNMLVPAMVICAGVVVLVPLSPCLIFGVGPFPELGVAGAGVGTCPLLCGGNRGSSLVHPFRTQRGAFPVDASSLAAVSRYFSRGRDRRDYLTANQLDDRARHSVSRQRLRN